MASKGQHKEKLVVVVGLGEIGRPLFEHVRKGTGSARGVDIEPVEIHEPVGLMHVCYPFDVPSGFVATTARYAAKYRPEVVAINSTVHPGTSREVQAETGVPVVYSPVRGKHTRMAQDLLHYQKFVAGTDAAATERVRSHFAAIGFKTASVATPEALELAKLLETTYFGLLIAWAQEMERFAKKVGADYYDVVKFFSEIDYLPSHVFVPGHIGGHCVMPNIGILKSRFSSGLLDAIQASNELKAKELGLESGAQADRVRPIKFGT